MRARWEAQYASFRRCVSSLKAVQEFKTVNPLFPRLFSDPVALIEHLGSRSIDLDEIDAIYRVLVHAAQQGSQFASAALWLGLWKGLDGIHRRWARRYTSDNELVADLGVMFTLAIHAADLAAITQVAATLIWNTERRLIHQRKRHDRRLALEDELPERSVPKILQREPPTTSALGMRLALPDASGTADVIDWVRIHLPARDAALTLVVATVVEGETQKDFADRAGMTPASVRKRHQRALRTLAKVSHFGGIERVYRVRGNKPPPKRARR